MAISEAYELRVIKDEHRYFTDILRRAIEHKLSRGIALNHTVFTVTTGPFAFCDYYWGEDEEVSDVLHVVFDVGGRYRGVDIEDKSDNEIDQDTLYSSL